MMFQSSVLTSVDISVQSSQLFSNLLSVYNKNLIPDWQYGGRTIVPSGHLMYSSEKKKKKILCTLQM